MLNAVLTYSQPNEWEPASYDTQRFRLFELRPGDKEYRTQVKEFEIGTPRLTVRSLKRVQNPYQLGRFIVRYEQKISRNENCSVVQCYHPVSHSDLNLALEYNMDVRRYSHSYSGQTRDSKNPLFYKSPGMAYNATQQVSETVILICDVLGDSGSNQITKSNDCDYMPTYVAELN